jgi:hypothetical protein
MKMRVDITTAMFYKLDRIARINQRTREEQILYYLDIGLDCEWQLCQDAIEAKLRQDAQHMDLFWQEHGDPPGTPSSGA